MICSALDDYLTQDRVSAKAVHNEAKRHFWEEDGQFYVGYDYRNRKVPSGAPEPRDIMGIRKMYFVNDWPTIWVPITVSLDTAETPLAVGKPLTIMERRVALRALFAKKHRRQRSNETPIISPAIE